MKLLPAFTASIFVCFTVIGCGGDSSNEPSLELEFAEVNHTENDHHILLALDRPGEGKTAAELATAAPESASATQLREASSDSATTTPSQPVDRTRFNVYDNKIVDSRGLGMANIYHQ